MRSRDHSALKERYSVLLDIGRTLAATMRPGELYRALWEQASRVIQAESFFVARYDAESDVATVVFFADRGEVHPLHLSYSGASSRAVQERKPVFQDFDDIERWQFGLEQPAHLRRSGMAAPILRGEEVLGVIGAQSYTADAYDDRDLELFSAIADLAGVALENALYVEQLERRGREAERLEEIGRAVTGSLELPKVLERVASAALDLLDVDGAVVWLIREDDSVEVAMTAGHTLFPQGLVFHVDPSVLDAIRRHPKRTFDNLSDATLAPPEYRAQAELTGSSVAVLLKVEDEFIGALSVRHRTPRPYADYDLRLLTRLADHAAIAVANARLHERILALSLTDPLTGLPNRRHLEMFLRKEFAAARRGRRLAVVLYDLDNFKAYNDSAGHQAGDEALRAFARILAENTREMNLTARFGGDEFIAVLTDIDRRGTSVHVQRIVAALEHHRLLGPAGIRVSAGIATFGANVRSPEALIMAADRDLYRRKQRQRQAAGTDA